MYQDDLMTLQECMLAVLDNPKDKRIIVETSIPNLTNIPNFNEVGETIYYMIDKAYGCGDELIKGTEWHVTNNEGAGTEAPDNQSVILLFSQFPDGCFTKIYVESY